MQHQFLDAADVGKGGQQASLEVALDGLAYSGYEPMSYFGPGKCLM